MQLTKRELEILPFLCLSHKEMAERLCISETTVQSHLTNLSFKFPEQKNKQSILIEAIKRGIISLDEVVTN